jgi:hypothetical protein
MNGSCDSAVFWFQPGNYYFNFTNAGAHEWVINDTTTRVVGGQPTAVPTDGQTFPGTWKATTVSASSLFTAPTDRGLEINGQSTPATFSSGTASLTATSYGPPPGQGLIPADATINSVTLRVSHSESSATALNVPTYTITAGGANCTGLPALTRRVGVLGEDRVDVTSCLNTPAKINGGLSVRYQIAHCNDHGVEPGGAGCVPPRARPGLERRCAVRLRR